MSALVPAPLSRTDIARIWRETTGGTQMDQCAEEFARRVERAAVEASAAPELLEALKKRQAVDAAYVRLAMTECDSEAYEQSLQAIEEAEEAAQDFARAAIAKATGGAA